MPLEDKIIIAVTDERLRDYITALEEKAFAVPANSLEFRHWTTLADELDDVRKEVIEPMQENDQQ